MYTRYLLTAPIIAFATINAATAQPGGIYARGLLHQPLGAAQLAPTPDGRVGITNIGSSGQDGVAIDLHSAWGGGFTLDIAPMLAATGAPSEIRVSPKGWDGMTKGSMRLISDGSGGLTEEYDYTPVNPAGLHWRLLGEVGQVLAEGDHPGPIISWGLEVDPPAGGEIVEKEYTMARPPGSGGGGGGSTGSVMRRAVQGFFDITCVVSGLTPAPISGVTMIEVTPEPCAGLPENCPPGWTNLQSLSLTANGLSSISVGGAHLGTFDLHCWGIGDTQVGEVCDDGDCDDGDSGIVVTNIGSSGQDGVSIDLGRSSAGGSTTGGGVGGVALRSKRCPDCPPGHVTLMKAYDDAGTELRMMHTLTDPLTGDEQIAADFTAIGATAYVVTLYDASGDVIGPPGGVECVIGGPGPTMHTPGAQRFVETLFHRGVTGGCSTHAWRLSSPDSSTADVTLPGLGTVAGVQMCEFEPVNPTLCFGGPRQCTVTATGPSSLSIDGVDVTRLLRGDTDCTGVVDFFDIDPFLQVLFNPREYSIERVACSPSNADCDGSGVVDFFDIDPFLACLFGSCP